MTLDRRVTPARPDLAAAHLQGEVTAARYVEGRNQRVAVGAAPLRGEPRPDASLFTEALFGETFTVYDEHEGWAWGQLATDDYVGWLPLAALTASGAAATHRVAALRSFVFPGPSIKLPPEDLLPFNARLTVVREEGPFAILDSGGFVHKAHLAPIDRRESDMVAVAERFLGTPYLWGGRTSVGLDCSALVQMALDACGQAAPRDSDMQFASLGHAVDINPAALQRGDLVFWKGHVAIARGDGNFLHANGFAMAVTIENVEATIARIVAAGEGEVLGVRRLD
ncbi:peptidase P60 [Agaricicola taiwanensis]|uniref:Peptidase P60 n=1 Tax=Agaricicola taiwanensis TaxID=591372 RepID=A0A8J2VN83_9RHOB|nr:NlpC/P60 family protein [Agaricicola taiwanensis]GGE33265.1 peptidase P60 [Agaricicola taiwanensis]